MQPLIPGVIKKDPANAYIVGMEDADATRTGHIRTLINGLVADGVWPALIYLGVIQHTENDSLTCLVRLTQSFDYVQSPTDVSAGCSPLLFIADSGFEYTPSANTGGITSGFTPDVSDTIYRDAHGFFTFMSAMPSLNSLNNVHGRQRNVTKNGVTCHASSSTDVYLYDLAGGPTHTALSLGGTEYFFYSGRDNASTGRMHRGSNVITPALTRSGTFVWADYAPDGTIHHYGSNYEGVHFASYKAAGDQTAAWGGTDGTLDTTKVNALRTRLTTYLTAIGAI